MDEVTLTSTIEDLRYQMVKLAMEKGSLVDESVVAISQKLDEYIVIYQRIVSSKRFVHPSSQ